MIHAETTRIRILLADDHGVVRAGLRALLETQADMMVVAEAEDGDAAVYLAAKHRPNIVIADLSMPHGGMSTISWRRGMRASTAEYSRTTSPMWSAWL